MTGMCRSVPSAVTRVTRVVDVVALVVALFAPVPAGVNPAVTVAVGSPVPVVLVECWEDLSCSDGSTLDTWDCARPSFIDDRGRLVHSNGRCGGVW